MRISTDSSSRSEEESSFDASDGHVLIEEVVDDGSVAFVESLRCVWQKAIEVEDLTEVVVSRHRLTRAVLRLLARIFALLAAASMASLRR